MRYNNDDVIRPLCIKLPQMIGYIKTLKVVIRQCLSRLVITAIKKVQLDIGKKPAV